LPRPVPKDGEVLVRILATSVTAGDWRVRTLDVPRGLGLFARLAFGFTGPRRAILGTELAGIVHAVGSRVSDWRVGDTVLGFAGGAMGCHAQYRVMAADGPLARKPEALDFEEAASICFGGSTALHFMRKANLKAGERLLVIGASGGVGSALVQLARHRGVEVVGVTSTANLALVASLGASATIDYTRADVLGGGETWDVIADTVGETSFARCRHALKPGGRLLAIAGGVPEMIASLRPQAEGKRVIAGPAEDRAQDVADLAALAASGALRPVIDRRYGFDELRQAHAHVETRRKKGSVVVTVPHD